MMQRIALSLIALIALCGAALAQAPQNVRICSGSPPTCTPINSSNPMPTGAASEYPTGAVPITISATGSTGSTAATLAAGSTTTTYICGFAIRSNATAAATGNATVAGTITGTMNFTHWTAPLASGIGTTEEVFSPCVPASAVNTTIVVTGPAPGSGGTISVSAWGYRL